MNNNIEQEVVKDCPLLFKMYGRPMNETCLSFGFECNEGWHSAIANTCRDIEVWNNLLYPKYRVRIQAAQIKEKFGTLRFYYDVVVDSNAFIVKTTDILTKIVDWFSYSKRFDYKVKRIYDIEPSEKIEKTEISKEEYDKHVKHNNVSVEEIDGKYFRLDKIYNCGKFHYVPTKHKIAWKIKNCFVWLRSRLSGSFIKDNAETRNVLSYLDNIARRYINDLEHECESICEFCGRTIGTDWSPKCQTVGWIKYICQDCAEKKEINYYMNGKLYKKERTSNDNS